MADPLRALAEAQVEGRRTTLVMWGGVWRATITAPDGATPSLEAEGAALLDVLVALAEKWAWLRSLAAEAPSATGRAVGHA